jgi:DNA-binding beta-propeller fold protein YncE
VISNNSILKKIANGSGPRAIAFDSSNDQVYVADCGEGCGGVGKSGLAAISNSTLTANITAGSAPLGLVYDSSDNYLYMANNDNATVSVVSANFSSQS